MLASQFRERMERFLGSNSEISFSLSGEQAKKLSGSNWERPVEIKISREPHGLRFKIETDIHGEAFELHGNKPRIFETTRIGEGYSGYKPTEGNPLDQEIGWLEEWIGIATRLEELRKNPETASSAPVAT